MCTIFFLQLTDIFFIPLKSRCSYLSQHYPIDYLDYPVETWNQPHYLIFNFLVITLRKL